jgi:GDP-4-dehydro-6-deoxy-D-mannose reductase
MKIIISGVNGFVGKHLSKELIAAGHVVYGVGHETNSLQSEVDNYYSGDITDLKFVNSLPWENIDGVIHLAGKAAVGPSFDNPVEYSRINQEGVIAIGESIKNHNAETKCIFVSTGSVYDSIQSMPLNEKSKIKITSPYVASKINGETIANYYTNLGQRWIIVRPFNHIGPGQSEGFIIPDIVRRLTIEKSNTLKVGNLETSRDYTDVRDIVKAYKLLIESEFNGPEIYNISSCNTHKGSEILKMIAEELSIDLSCIDVVKDKRLIRANEIMSIKGNNKKIFNKTGWVPKINIKTSIQDYIKGL